MLISSYKRRLVNGHFLLPRELAVEYRSISLGDTVNVVARPSCQYESVELFGEVDRLIYGTDDNEELLANLYTDTVVLPIPWSRRLSLPKTLCLHAGMDNELTLLTIGRKTQLISTSTWRTVSRGSWVELQSFVRQSNCSVLDDSNNPLLDHSDDVKTAANEALLRSPNPRLFEQAVAEIFESKGVGLVELTQPSKDDGIDVVVYAPNRHGKVDLLYVQCKSGNVRINDFREMIGVVARDGAQAGLLVGYKNISSGCYSEAFVSRIMVSATTLDTLASWIEERDRKRTS